MSKTLLIVPGCGIPVLDNEDGSYSFTAGFMIDGDGTGSSHGDPDFQPNTSYKPDLNADVDPYIVLPREVFLAVVPDVLGCKAEVNGVPALVGDEGPSHKIGEGSIALAKALGVPSSPTSGGDATPLYKYTFWPGVPAVVNGKTYVLQPIYES